MIDTRAGTLGTPSQFLCLMRVRIDYLPLTPTPSRSGQRRERKRLGRDEVRRIVDPVADLARTASGENVVLAVLPPRASMIGLRRWPLPLLAPPTVCSLNQIRRWKDFFMAKMESTWVKMEQMDPFHPSDLSAMTPVACALGYDASFPSI